MRRAARPLPRSAPWHAECLDRIVAAAREEPAVGADHRAYRPLIGAHAPRRMAAGSGRPPGRHATPALLPAPAAGPPAAPRNRVSRVPSRPIRTRSTPIPASLGQHQPGSFLQAAAGAVADHGVADLLRHGETQPCRTTRHCVAAPAAPALASAPCAPWPPHAGTPRGASGGRVAWPSSPRFRPTGACGPWRGGWPAPCGLRRWPCGRGTRAAACGPASTVDRCASRAGSPMMPGPAQRARAPRPAPVAGGGL